MQFIRREKGRIQVFFLGIGLLLGVSVSQGIERMREGTDMTTDTVDEDSDMISIEDDSLREILHVGINSVDAQGNTRLHIAAMEGQDAEVEGLLGNREIEVFLTNSEDDTPVSLAIKAGHPSIAIRLLGHPGMACHVQERAFSELLYLAAERGYEEVVMKLLTFPRINVNMISVLGDTPADVAKRNGHMGIAQLLWRVTQERATSREYRSEMSRVGRELSRRPNEQRQRARW